MCDYIKMDQDTWRLEDGFVRFFLLIGTKRAVMIDSGMTKCDAREICERLTELPITLVNTHGEVILPADYPKKILCSWQKVMDGEIRGIGMEMHGNPVQLYKTDFCGFILQ